MKKIFFKSMLLLCALIVGLGVVWADEVTFTPGTDTGETSVTKSGVTCTMTTMNNSSYYQIYANQSGTFACSSGNITKIEFTCTASGTSKYGPGNASANVGSYSYSGTNGTWTGEATSVTISSTAQVRMSSLTITYTSAAPAYSITAQSNNNTFGTVSLEGSVITGSPNAGYRYASPAYSVSPANSATVSQDGNTFTVTPSANTSITINFEAIPTHTATFSVNGNTTSQDFQEGADIVFPSDPENINSKIFVGWVADAIVGSTDLEPSFITSAVMGESDVTYYAVFATAAEGTDIVTDELFSSSFGSPSSYTIWSNKKATDGSNARYSGQSTGGNSYIQMRATSPSGIVSSTSGGKVKKVSISWNSSTSTPRSLKIYGKNSAYSNLSGAAELYSNETSGSELGSIVYNTSTELTISEDYTYIGILPVGGAMYIDEIDIDWEIEVTTYSAYCTTVSALPVPTITFKDGEDNEITELNANNLNAFIPISVTCSAGDVTLSFESSDDEVAEYDEGNVLTYTEGTTTITATFAGNGSYQGTSATLTVNVERATTTLSFPATPATINIDATATYAATSSPYVSGITYSSNNTSALTVNSETGEITGVAKGSATITASFAGNDNYKPTSKSYTILVVNPNEISYTLTNSQIVIGGPDAESGYASKVITDENDKSWNAYAIKNYHSGNTSSNHYLQIRAYNDPTKYYIQVPAYGTRITELQMTVSGSNKTIDGGGNTATLFFSASNTTSATGDGVASGTGGSTVTIDCSALNLNTGYITADGAVRIWDVKVTYEYALTIGSALWTSHVTTDAVDFTGVTAYIAKAVNGETISLKEVTSAPANTPVIIKGDAQKTYYLQTKYSSLDDVSGNLLQASDGSVAGDGSTIYALGVGKAGENKGKVGFFLVQNEVAIPKGKAYLTYSGGGSAPSMLHFVKEENNATSIDAIQASEKAIKLIENGRILILRDGITYDALGRVVK